MIRSRLVAARSRSKAKLARFASPVAVIALVSGCASTRERGGGIRDAGADSADGFDAESGVDARAQDVPNGEPCAFSEQCRGGCCELHGNTTVCAQITPFDTAQNCACGADKECAAIRLCGQPGFCQEPNEVAPQRFCSRVCK